MSNLLPGVKGSDYHFVKFGGQIYVVYGVSGPGMPNFRISFKLDPKDYKAYGVDPKNVNAVNSATFSNFQHLGLASDIILNGTDHPWTQFLQGLQKDYNASWLNDKQFLGTMLQGFFDGWSADQTQQRLTQTKWYQTRTSTQRDWVSLGRADKNAAVSGVLAQMDEQLRTLYGPDYALKDTGLTQKKLNSIAQNIASGQFGTLEEGFQVWTQKQRDKAEKVDGTPAWMAREQQIEAARAFSNRPEDAFQQLKTQSQAWLGPHGTLDDSTLKNWADRLVTQKSSQADWEQFIQKQASALYPWLNPGETWQDRASSYKQIAEKNLGGPVNWDDPLLAKLGGMDTNGTPTGAAMTFDEYQKAVRSDGRFWQGSQAANETYSLFNHLNSVFNGSGAA